MGNRQRVAKPLPPPSLFTVPKGVFSDKMAARQGASSQVAESSFSFLHMELVQLALGDLQGKEPTTSQLQHAARKIEAIGFQVGVRLVERYTKDRPRFADTLEIIKFLCKEFWMEVFRKQVDKLQTNNRVRAWQFTTFPGSLLFYLSRLLTSVAPGCCPAGRVHAAGQCAPRARTLLTDGLAAGHRQAARGATHQIPEWAHPRGPFGLGRRRLSLRRGERAAPLPVHHQNLNEQLRCGSLR